MRKSLSAVVFVLTGTFPTALFAETIDLTCSYDRDLDVKGNTLSPTTGQFTVQIELSDERIAAISVSKGGWCDVRDALVSDAEISFPCGFDLPGQRITYSFTLDRTSGSMQQRFFVRGKLRLIRHGLCTLAKG